MEAQKYQVSTVKDLRDSLKYCADDMPVFLMGICDTDTNFDLQQFKLCEYRNSHVSFYDETAEDRTSEPFEGVIISVDFD